MGRSGRARKHGNGNRPQEAADPPLPTLRLRAHDGVTAMPEGIKEGGRSADALRSVAAFSSLRGSLPVERVAAINGIRRHGDDSQACRECPN